jgi:hypothetical protein
MPVQHQMHPDTLQGEQVWYVDIFFKETNAAMLIIHPRYIVP